MDDDDSPTLPFLFVSPILFSAVNTSTERYWISLAEYRGCCQCIIIQEPFQAPQSISSRLFLAALPTRQSAGVEPQVICGLLLR